MITRAALKRQVGHLRTACLRSLILILIITFQVITVLPKMMNDPEAKREMEQMQQNMSVQNQVKTNGYTLLSSL